MYEPVKWFAWYPVKIWQHDKSGSWVRSSRRWAWLKTVERMSSFGGGWIHCEISTPKAYEEYKR